MRELRAAARDRGHPDHAQPRSCRRPRRPRRRHVRRAARSKRRPCTSCSRTRSTRTRSACSTRSRAWGRSSDANVRVSRRSRAAFPSLAQLPQHCAFAPRCPRADELTWSQVPELREVRPRPLRRLLPSPEAGGPGERARPRGRRASRSTSPSAGSCSAAAGVVYAVDGVSFTIAPGEVLGPRGRVRQREVDGRPAASCVCSSRPTARSGSRAGTSPLSRAGRCVPLRRQLHMVFQDPYSSLNPRMTYGRHRRRADPSAPPRPRPRAIDVSSRRSSTASGCAPELQDRYPHELSGGQRQRVGLARSLVLHPSPADRRRARLGPRRVGAGGDPQLDQRPASRDGLLVSLHHA